MNFKVFQRRNSSGFTLIELMMAMLIFSILIVICAQLFQQARMAWSTGQAKVDKGMVGRSVLDCIARELRQAIDSNITITATSIEFRKISAVGVSGDPFPLVKYSFTGAMLERNSEPICPGVVDAAPTPGIQSMEFSPSDISSLPESVDIKVTVATDGSSDPPVTFQTRVWFPNMYRFD
jgi:prepilin-type N-terminal cleavage/methylation domain-containing protein